MRFRTRKRLAILALAIGVPAYIVVAVTLVGLIGRPPVLVELGIYVGLGILWAVPLRRLFLGVGRGEDGR
mgnify:CR=1 FL=1